MSSLTTEERGTLESIFRDLQLLFGKDEILPEEVDDLIDQLESEEAKSYVRSLKEAKPETALSDAFFAGRSVLKKYLFGDATPEAVVGEGFIDYKVRAPGEKIILVELKPLFESKTRRVKAGRELRSLKQKRLKYEEHKNQILKYIQEGGEYIVLTNLKDWVFFSKSVTAAEFEPFASTGMIEFHKEFEVERNLWDYLTRLDQQSIREDLDKLFFESLKMWVNKLSEVEFTVDENRKTELIINLINKFIFVQTLDDYRVIEPRWIQQTWGHNERRWGSKGKGQVLKEFFRELDNWFYQYYDTELFRDEVLNYVKQERRNLDLFHKNLRLVLGLEYWMTALGGFRGIIQYNFRYIDEDILGKAYETYLADVRHEEGIYYTPKFITQYIVENTVGDRLDKIVIKLRENIEKENLEELKVQLVEFTSIRVLDPACGSGSFLIKAIRKIWEKYKEVEALLREAERKHNKWQGSFEGQKEIAEKVEKLHQVMDILGPRNDRGLISRILVRHIHGNDKDKKALDVAKLNIWLEAIKLSPAEFRYDKLPEDTNYILPDLEMNLCNGDSVVGLPENRTVDYLIQKHKEDVSKLCELRNEYLADPSNPKLVEQIAEIKTHLRNELDKEFRSYLESIEIPISIIEETIPFHWALDFWYFYFDSGGRALLVDQRGADIIIGNPPYERIQVLNKKAPVYVEYLNRAGYESSFRNYDLSVIFVEKGTQLLNLKGKFGYILPNKFMQQEYGKKLRAYILRENLLSKVVDFGHLQVFDDATTYTCLLFLDRVPRSSFCYKKVITLQNIENYLAFEQSIQELNILDVSILSDTPWFFYSREEEDIIINLSNQSKIQDIAESIFVGLQTSADKVYISEKRAALNQGRMRLFSRSLKREVILEKTLLRPLLSGMDVGLFTKPVLRQFILFPYKVEDEKAELLSLEEIHRIAPLTYSYLLDNKEILESRERGKFRDAQWWRFGRTQNLGIQEKVKICVPRLVFHLRSFFDEKGEFYLDNVDVGGLTLKEKTEQNYRYVNALLNSTLLTFYLHKISTPFRGGWRSCNKQYLSRLPVKMPKTENERTKVHNISRYVKEILIVNQSKNQIREIWKEWVTKMKNYDMTLHEILSNDLMKIREGQFNESWTTRTTMYPNNDELFKERYVEFRIEGDSDSPVIRVYGLKSTGQEVLMYEMEFIYRDLMLNIYFSMTELLESRRKVFTLSQLLSKTVVSVIKPDAYEKTRNIIKRVRLEVKRSISNITHDDIVQMDNKIEDLRACIDAAVFDIFELDAVKAGIVMKSPGSQISYQKKVLDKLAKLTSATSTGAHP